MYNEGRGGNSGGSGFALLLLIVIVGFGYLGAQLGIGNQKNPQDTTVSEVKNKANDMIEGTSEDSGQITDSSKATEDSSEVKNKKGQESESSRDSVDKELEEWLKE